MSLLEKASVGTKKDRPLPSQARSSLFTRAMAASRAEADASPAQVPSTAPALDIDIDALDDLKHYLESLPPSFDSILAAWSLISSRLPLSALSLFLPQGDLLYPAARIGFPSGSGDAVPLSIAPPAQNPGSLLDDEATALVAPSLGVSVGFSMRAVSMFSDSGLVGLWVYHDDSLDNSSDELRSRVNSLLAEATASLPPLSIFDSSSDPVSSIMEGIGKFRFATAIRYAIEPVYSDSDALRGLSMKALRSAFVSASAKILEQGGVALAYGEGSIVCVLGSPSGGDPDLFLFQLTKTLKRSLPFIASEKFPVGSVTSFDLASDRVSEELSRFLSV
jgi:hypothetical protein